MPFLQKKPIFFILPQRLKGQSTTALLTYPLMNYALTRSIPSIFISLSLRGYFFFFAC